MLSLETRINGTLIGYTYIKNELNQDNDGNYLYEVEHCRFDRKPNVIGFNLLHKREDGAERLLFLVYREIDKRLKKCDVSKK
ncbi:MAG: hypothetical protein NTU63_03215 [Candidatus Pacearchaeota archaeon]|nr:hypothetical protein [Candidatus Pacearchaeota archaeon]